MFQVAMLSVSSSFEDGIPAFAILNCRTLRPWAISGEISPWFTMISLYACRASSLLGVYLQMSCHSEGAARRICFRLFKSRSFAEFTLERKRRAQDDRPFASRIA